MDPSGVRSFGLCHTFDTEMIKSDACCVPSIELPGCIGGRGPPGGMLLGLTPGWPGIGGPGRALT